MNGEERKEIAILKHLHGYTDEQIKAKYNIGENLILRYKNEFTKKRLLDEKKENDKRTYIEVNSHEVNRIENILKSRGVIYNIPKDIIIEKKFKSKL